MNFAVAVRVTLGIHLYIGQNESVDIGSDLERFQGLDKTGKKQFLDFPTPRFVAHETKSMFLSTAEINEDCPQVSQCS